MSIFRKSSLDKLSSPEQLDNLIRITSPKSWMTLAFFVLIIASTVIWSLVGSIPKIIQAQGIILSSGGTQSVISPVEGEISDITIEKNDYVMVGETIARVSQKTLVEEAAKIDQQIKEVEGALLGDQPNELDITESTLSLIDIKNQIADIEKQIEKSKSNDPTPKLEADITRSRLEIGMVQTDLEKKEKELESAETTLERNQVLFDSGAISLMEYEKYLDAKNAADSAKKSTQLSLAQSQENQNSLQKQYIQAKEGFMQDSDYLIFKRTTLQMNFSATKVSKLDTLYKKKAEIKEKLKDSEIVSGVEGQVVSLAVKKGNVVQKGLEIAKVMEKGNTVNESNAVFYVPLEKGKKLIPGMRVSVYPSTANRQEYGHMIAIVTTVSKYVVSGEEMKAKLGNDELVNTFLKEGVLVQVDAYLLKDSTTESSYYWSNKKGGDLTVLEGTLCNASFIVEKNKPITLLLPLLKEKISPFEQ